MSNASIHVIEGDADKPSAAVAFLEDEVERAREAVAAANRKLDQADVEKRNAELARDAAEAHLAKTLGDLDVARALLDGEG